MSEYKFVEKPFLDQLAALQWSIIDQGSAIPTDPSKSLRSSFHEIVIKEELFKALQAINKTEDGQSWLSDKQLDEIYSDLTGQSGGLVEANQAIQSLLYKYTTDQNDLTGEVNPDVQIIDFKNPEKNRFLAINQYRIDTPGCVKTCIIPDIVLFVNGLPLAVVECKDGNSFTSNPMSEAMIQLWRYSNQRAETRRAGLREGEERLFHFNQLMIATDGENARIGSITSNSDQYFYGWRSIYPEKYQNFTSPLGKTREQETLIQGTLPKETFLDIVRNFTIFMQVGENTVKVIPRYQQYRAVQKMVKRIREGKTPFERSGVVWHTQGSGKSLTMVFLIRKLRHTADMKDFKIVMVNDRTDLEDQLSTTATLTGEKVDIIGSSDEVKKDLANDKSNLNMVMVHKFAERDVANPAYLNQALTGDVVPHFKPFGLVNGSERILVLIDEAHRTQSSDLGNNLFEAFPNATKIAFTGTPLITDRHTEKTVNRFGDKYIDEYKLQDAVDDGATVQILYEGKTADTAINAKHEFDRKFEDLFKDRTPDEMAAIKKKYGALGDVMEAEGRIQEICDDVVEHYCTKILPNGFKAQIVCHSKDAALAYQTCLRKALAAYIEKVTDVGVEHIQKIKFLKTAVVMSSDGTNEKAAITQARKEAKQIDAVESFKKKFNFEKPETGVAFLIVCDMLLTGFDAPIEQVMYLDKRISEHNLLQAIARVNRVSPGKSKGYIVDYIGLSKYLKEALSIYAVSDQEEILASFKNVDSELPTLEARYKRLINLFEDAGITRTKAFIEQTIKDTTEEYQVLEEILDSMDDATDKENLKRRETFNVYLKKFISSLDVIMPNPQGKPYVIPAKRFGYLHAKARQRFKDDSISIAGAGEKVKHLIDEHLIGLGINPKIPPTELFSDVFIKDLGKNKSAKSKASEMEHAIRKHCKVHLAEDPAFFKTVSEKLDAAIQKHKDSWEQLCLELINIREETLEGRTGQIEGLDPAEAPFYDLILMIAYKGSEVAKSSQNAIKDAVKQIYEEFQNTIDIVNFWQQKHEVRQLNARLKKILALTNENPLIDSREQISNEILSLAKNRHNEILSEVDHGKHASG